MKKLGRNQEIVPVVMFHSVGMNHEGWIWRHLSETAHIFEKFLKRLKKANYKTVTLQQLFAHMSGDRICDPKSIALVFDDGYLDNWVTVYPLLRKYEMCGTVYVNPEFVEPNDECRPTLDDYTASETGHVNTDQRGFMNWAELRKADSEGILDVQSHSMSHTWYFKGPSVVDCYAPQNAKFYPWMQWNARPERKPYYLREDQTQFVDFGTPIFEHEKSLVTRRFLPDAGKILEVQEEIRRSGETEFFLGSALRKRFDDVVSSVIGKDSIFPGEFESEDAYRARVEWELVESKSLIETRLDKTVDYLCWPGGGVNDIAKAAARKAGYRSWTVPGRDSTDKRNQPGENPKEIKRMPAMRDVYLLGKRWGFGTETLMILDVYAHQNSIIFDAIRKIYKTGVALGVAGNK
jgi:peptidoglycan/xylan/chitin deacetylase (PgdA/CDA1 family)